MHPPYECLSHILKGLALNGGMHCGQVVTIRSSQQTSKRAPAVPLSSPAASVLPSPGGTSGGSHKTAQKRESSAFHSLLATGGPTGAVTSGRSRSRRRTRRSRIGPSLATSALTRPSTPAQYARPDRLALSRLSSVWCVPLRTGPLLENGALVLQRL